VPATLELKGLDELRTALRNLPDDLTDEADAIVQAHADEAARQIRGGYPAVSGNLQRGVTVERNTSKLTSTAVVRSRARHAHLFEHGTGPRRTGSGASRGVMPKAPSNQQMIPIAIRVRGRMVRLLIDLVRRAGFEVS